MIKHLKTEALHFGLKVHAGKTKVLINSVAGHRRGAIQIDGKEVTVRSPNESEKYLGRRVCISTPQTTELPNRIAVGWAALTKNTAGLQNTASGVGALNFNTSRRAVYHK